MKVSFRLDDIFPEMDIEKFNEVEELFLKHKVKPLIGIIPDNLDLEISKSEPLENFWNKMRSLKELGWMISQHGYQHIMSTTNGGILNINNYGEFAGLPYHEQYDQISRGKKILKNNGVNSDIFMAPAHSFDKNTLRALKQLGFKYVTDGYSFYPYYRNGLKFIPCQSSKGLKLPFGNLTVCIHSNSINDEYIRTLEKFIIKHRKSIVSYEEMMQMKSYGSINKWSEKMILLMRNILKGKRLN